MKINLKNIGRDKISGDKNKDLNAKWHKEIAENIKVQSNSLFTI